MKILIAPGTTGIGMEIMRSLRRAKQVQLLGCGFDAKKGLEQDFSDFIFMPKPVDASHLSRMLTSIVKSHEIDLIYLAHDQWLRFLTCIDLPREMQERIINLPSGFNSVLLSKRQTYATLNIKHLKPKIIDLVDSSSIFPVFAKPDIGQGSINARAIHNQDELRKLLGNLDLKSNSEYVITEFLPGPEFTIDCFSNSRHEVLYSQSRIRMKTHSGIAIETRQIDLPNINEWAEAISQQYNLIGAWFFQLKEDMNGNLKLLEIGIRVAGASGINRVLGVNLALMNLYQFLGHQVKVLKQNIDVVYFQPSNSARVSLKIRDAFFDYDDTLTHDGIINERIKEHMLKLHNAGSRVFLLTRNQNDLDSSLSTCGLLPIIERVIKVTNSEKKSDFIVGAENFLFVDDSHQERLDVYSNKGKRGLILDPSAFETDLKFD